MKYKLRVNFIKLRVLCKTYHKNIDLRNYLTQLQIQWGCSAVALLLPLYPYCSRTVAVGSQLLALPNTPCTSIPQNYRFQLYPLNPASPAMWDPLIVLGPSKCIVILGIPSMYLGFFRLGTGEHVRESKGEGGAQSREGGRGPC